MQTPAKALKEAYDDLLPYSNKYTVDFDRYVFSLKLLSQLPNISAGKVLDVGTGIGLMPLALKKMGISASGLDYYIFPESDNKMFGLDNISNYKKIWDAQNIQVFNKNIFEQDLPDSIGTFDVILSEATIEHLKDPRLFLKQCHSLLKPGGHLLITTPNAATLIKRLRFMGGLSPYWPISGFYEDGEAFTGHWREYTMFELVYMCQKSGFSVVEHHTKNMLTKFKGIKNIRKNLRALFSLLSAPFPGMREMHFILCKKD